MKQHPFSIAPSTRIATLRLMLSRLMFCRGLFVITTCVCGTSSFADTVAIGTLRIPVTQFRAVDDRQVKVVGPGVEEILARPDAELKAIEIALDDASFTRALTLDQIHELVRAVGQRIVGKGERNAFAGNNALITLWAAKLNGLALTDQPGAIVGVLTEPEIRSVISAVPLSRLLELSDGGIALAAEMAVQDPALFEVRAVGFDPNSPSVLSLGSAIEELGLAAIANRNLDRAAKSGEALSALKLGERGRVLMGFVQRAAESFAGTQIEKAKSLLALQRSVVDGRYQHAIAGLVNEAVHEAARESLAQGAPDTALEILSQVALERTNPGTHRLVVDALNALTNIPRFGGILVEDATLRDWVISWAKLDKTIAQALEQCVVAVGKAAAARSDVDLSRSLSTQFADLLSVSSKDALLKTQALTLLAAGQREAARSVVKQRSGQSWSDIFSFARAGLYGGFFSSIYYGLSVLLFFLLIGIRFWDRRRSATQVEAESTQSSNSSDRWSFPPPHSAPGDAHATVSADEEEPSEIKGGFARGTFAGAQNLALTPSALEYRKLLSSFQLKSDASLREIKQTYRSKVKGVHPDLNPNLSAEGREQFVTITQAYERILELRVTLGIAD